MLIFLEKESVQGITMVPVNSTKLEIYHNEDDKTQQIK